MTDREQIIINGVDVWECINFNKKDKVSCCHPYFDKCYEVPNCSYKQLIRKTQECEELKKGYAELTKIVSPYMDDFTGYNEELGGFDPILCVKELFQQLAHKMQENEELKKNNQILCDLYKNVDSSLQKRTEKFDRYRKVLKDIEKYCNDQISLTGDLPFKTTESDILDIINKVKKNN